MATDSFFTTVTEQSRVKVQIVTKYFCAWSQVMLAQTKKRRGGTALGYADLYAGPGQYKDGTESTPLLILKRAISHPDLSRLLVARFNDADSANTAALQRAVAALSGVETLAHRPVYSSAEVTDQFAARIEKARLPPTLFFLDPWGYRGLSLRLVRACIAQWGCDCIFFFNYKRVNAGLENDAFAQHMDALFGRERAARLRPMLDALGEGKPKERERLIVEELLAALEKECRAFALRFPFATDTGAQTSHYLMFVSKGRLGHDIMKQIMAGTSSSAPQGVPCLGFNPAEKRQPMLPFSNLDRPLDDLQQDLLGRFAGRRMTVEQIFSEHNVKTNFVLANYKEVLRRLEEQGTIQALPSAAERRKAPGGKITMPDDVEIIFPDAIQGAVSGR